MIGFDFLLLACSLWMGYQFMAFNNIVIPSKFYVSLLNNSNIFIGMAKMMCVKWGIVFAIMGIFLFIARRTVFKDIDVSGVLSITIFYLVYSGILLL